MTTDLITDKELAELQGLLRSNQEPEFDRIVARLREAERLLDQAYGSDSTNEAITDYFARVRQS